MRTPPRQSLKIPGVASRYPSSARPTLNLAHALPVPSQGRARLAGEPKRRRERRERGSCRTSRPPSRAPVKGAPSGRRRRGAGGSPCDVSRQRMTWSQAARTRVGPQEGQTPLGPRDGAFDPSAIEVSVRVEGVTRTVPGPRRRAACPSWAPGVAAKNGACPELMSNSSRGVSSFVETVKPNPLRAKSRRPAQPSHRPRSREAARLVVAHAGLIWPNRRSTGKIKG